MRCNGEMKALDEWDENAFTISRAEGMKVRLIINLKLST